MFVKEIEYYDDTLAYVFILYDTEPAELPTTSTGIEGIRAGLTFAPGSVISIGDTGKIYMLYPEGWVEQ